jgi:hypothetical protein
MTFLENIDKITQVHSGSPNPEYEKMIADSHAEKMLDLLSLLVIANDCSEMDDLVECMEKAIPIFRKYCGLDK